MTTMLDMPQKHIALAHSNRSYAWAEGLQGLASALVVVSHLTSCFAEHVENPSLSPNGPITLFQRPFLRLIVQGESSVAILFVLLGYMHSVKIIQLAQCGAPYEALSSLATRSFHRFGRLFFPTAAATIIAWFLCQLGAFRMAQQSNINFLQRASPDPSENWYTATTDLFHELSMMWLQGYNKYEPQLWTVTYLLQGTLLIYTTLMATVVATSNFRMLAYVTLYLWSWSSGYALIRMNVFAGMIMAELINRLPSRRTPRVLSIISYPLAFLGLYLLSYPQRNAYYAAWSRNLQSLGSGIFPSFANDFRYWQALGAQLLCAAILMSPSMQKFLSHNLLQWLGRRSFSMYVVQGTVLRVVLAAFVYVCPPPARPRMAGTVVSAFESAMLRFHWPTLLIIAVFWVVLLNVVNVWSTLAEPYFDEMSAKLDLFSRSWGQRSVNDKLYSSSPSEDIKSSEDDSTNLSSKVVDTLDSSPFILRDRKTFNRKSAVTNLRNMLLLQRTMSCEAFSA